MLDVIIVGSGPAGYTAAIYAARASLKPLVVAGSVSAGGALMQTTEVENFPGFPEGIMGPDLMENMQAQAQRFGADIRLEDAEELHLEGDVKKVVTDEGEYQARTVIVATGSAHRKLGVPGEDAFAGRGVSYCATCDGFFFKDKPIVVVGGGDSAIEEATFLSRFGSKVTVVHRRDQLRASQAMQQRAFADPKIDFAWHQQVVRIEGDIQVSHVVLRDTQTGQESKLEAAGVFVAIGQDPRTELFAGKLRTDAAGYVLTEPFSQKTNIPGVFVCGDVADPHYQQAITAAASGCRAALDAEHYLLSTERN
ncbi:MAG: thioredoxin-disulfide reductase [Actinomycetaceae bacterium]|nr:thioredoxin-disulfide reductase [Actinomycetaceae bacterium]